MDNGVKYLLDGVEFYVDNAIENVPCDKTFVGVIKGISEDGYDVEINGTLYQDVQTMGGVCSVDETVNVKIPLNNYNNMYIEKYKEGSGSGSGGNVNSVNGKSGNVVLNANDVGALPKDTPIPKNTSQLNNDSGFIVDNDYIHTDNNYTNQDKDKLNGLENTYVKGQAEDGFRKGEVNLTQENLGIWTGTTVEYQEAIKNGTIKEGSVINITDDFEEGGGGGSGTTNYIRLINKPSINDVELIGNKTLKDLGIINTVVKGQSENLYRSGEVNLTQDDLGIWTGTKSECDKAITQGIIKEGSVINITDDFEKPTEGGTKDYKVLENKPKINNVILDGNKSLNELGIQPSGRYLTKESDPTVPQWAKQSVKPSYTKAEVGLGNVPNVTTDNQTPTFSEPRIRENINSGEKLSKILGKIKKYFSDLKSVAFTASYTDLIDKPLVPTKTSDLINDIGYVEDTNYVHTDNNYTNQDKTKLDGLTNTYVKGQNENVYRSGNVNIKQTDLGIWTGTKAEYKRELELGNFKNGALINITDDWVGKQEVMKSSFKYNKNVKLKLARKEKPKIFKPNSNGTVYLSTDDVGYDEIGLIDITDKEKIVLISMKQNSITLNAIVNKDRTYEYYCDSGMFVPFND